MIQKTMTFYNGGVRMIIKPIRNEKDYETALARVREIWDADEGTPESDELDVLVTLVEAYGDKHYPIEPLDPLDEIRYRLEEMGLSQENIETVVTKINKISSNTNVFIFPHQPDQKRTSLPQMK